MARRPIALTIPDVSQFAKTLRRALDAPIGHQTMLNAVARAAGFKNFQSLSASGGLDEAEPIDRRAVERALAWFDARGRMTGWPSRHKVQRLCLWAIWAQLPDRRPLNEREVSLRIDALCAFRDAAQIRRGLIEIGLMTRSRDGACYRRVGQRPQATERAVMAAVLTRAGRLRPGSGPA